MNKVKVLQITLRADIGGGPKHINTLINGLSSHVNFLIAAPNQEPFWDSYEHIVGSRNMIEMPFRRFSISYALKLIVFSWNHHVEIIHSHGKGAGIYGRLCAFILRIPLIHTPHGTHVSHVNLIKSKFYFVYEYLTSWINDLILFVSESERIQAESYGLYLNIRSLIIHNGVSQVSSYFDKKAHSLSLRDLVGIRQSGIVCISLSRFDESKNSMFTIEIAKLCSDISFVIFGDGRDREIMLERITKEGISNIYLPGVTTNSLSQLMGADCYFSTSTHEGLPLAVLEAMSCGLPVVASNVTGHVDCIEHGVTGFLYKSNDANDAAEYIKNLSANGDYRIALGNAGRDIQRIKFSELSLCQKILNIYHEFI